MAKIPYKNNYGMTLSSKGKIPWITFNGHGVPDSNFCIEFLNKEFNLDLDEDLTDEQRGASVAFRRMCDENTYWAMVYHRWIDHFDETRKFFKITRIEMVDKLICRIMQQRVRGQLNGHGIGLHNRDEVFHLANQDIKAVSDYLGEKKFMMGNKASLVDAAVFGIMANFVWADTDSPMHTMIKTNCQNIEKFCIAMKETFWPDWDEVVYHKKKIKSKL